MQYAHVGIRKNMEVRMLTFKEKTNCDGGREPMVEFRWAKVKELHLQ